ncbi:undecaprenyldiphospho-muramoylpentapeptide beta-N-acetylglucosaminyltransferase [Desmospora profundinema]|uniref:UDP-N-acetylglucosamine--N-acetylmuramyl-(pentapeptide) pyrophosphoryl-undecaprenol N-acetylglucosamine transferase n=1 Tax=Desmospora profundinema TaxID=1571184 RepID=A0ABU1IKX8_9BACL|nr:undecaprenyldiphospho-muramoylpentapeptide beta-N-acetylglucosaminyltransferase [Desmospora profundinema]MDR6224799.1 UDP-N-acetylglucosamine--N-acetylmuramyl-(pentapeptide) pyrophosphoryl-undecaprenol N-acetylglucosamine transferase [Desmospora profundinema]
MKKILLSGGGTGGHIYPALSIVQAVRRRFPDVEVAYIGTKNGLEATIVPKAGDIRFFDVEIQGFKRKLSLDNVQTVAKFLKAVRDCKEAIRSFEPEVVVGTGGYVSGPTLYAAAKMNVPTFILEPDVLPGLTTRFLTRYVDTVAVSLSGSEQYLTKAKRLIHTGNPRGTEAVQADAVKGRASLGLEGSDKPIVLIAGGSRGAKPINEAVLAMLPRMREFKELHFVFVTGEVHYDEVTAKLNNEPMDNLTVQPFIYNMPDVLAATSLMVGRSGASFLAELTALGIPSILVPSPYVTNNHQEMNARWLEEQGAGRMILERELTGNTLWTAIEAIMKDPESHHHMSEASKRLGRPDAAEVIVDELVRVSS